jgi:hypothetical protein
MAQKTNPKRTQNPPMAGMLTTILSSVTAIGDRDAVTSHGWSRGFKKKRGTYIQFYTKGSKKFKVFA